MTDNIIAALRIFMALFVPSLTGYAALRLMFFRKQQPGIMYTSLCFGIGIGILSQAMFLSSALGMTLSFLKISAILLIPSVAVLYFLSRRERPRYGALTPLSFSSVNFLNAVFYSFFFLYILWAVYFVFWQALNIPVSAWDEIGFISLKAKVFYFENSIDFTKNTTHPSYPLLVSLAQTWVAMANGAWNDQIVKIISPALFLSFAVLIFFFLNIYCGAKPAVAGAALTASSLLLLLHSTMLYRDIFMTYYTLAAVTLLLVWTQKNEDAFLWPAGICAGLGTFTKLEGTAYILIVGALFFFLLSRRKDLSPVLSVKRSFKFFLPVLFFCAPFYIYKILANIPPEKTEFEISFANISRALPIFKAFFNDLFFTGNWGVIWLLLLVSIAANAKKIRKSFAIRYLLLALAMFFAFYFANGMFTKNFVWIGGSGTLTTVSRLVLQFFPLATLLIILLNFQKDDTP